MRICVTQITQKGEQNMKAESYVERWAREQNEQKEVKDGEVKHGKTSRGKGSKAKKDTSGFEKAERDNR